MNARETATEETEAAPEPTDAETIQKIRAMPREIGVLLMVAGIGGLLLPGPIGTPFFVLGGVVLWPKAFERVENYLEKKFPRMHHQSMRQVNRFVVDLERRYPTLK